MFSLLTRKLMIGALALGVTGGTLVSSINQAEAGWRHGYGGNRGGALAAGIIGGVAVGALLGAASRPAYAAPAYGYGSPVYSAPSYYAPASGYYEEEPVYYRPTCHWQRQKIWQDPYTYTVRRVKICN